jgi:hypothetical protein
MIITQHNASNYSGDDLSTANYDVFFVWTDQPFTSSLLGPNINNFVGMGGGLVICVFASAGVSIDGFDYLNCPFEYSPQGGLGVTTSLVADIPTHPILHYVYSFYNGPYSGNNLLRVGATQVAHLNVGYPLIGTLEIGDTRTVGLNFFPPSSVVRSDFWNYSTDGDVIMINSILWAAHKMN